MKIRHLIPLFISTLAFTSCANANANQAKKPAEWTVLIYMCGSNLESDLANLTIYTDDYGNTYRWNGMGLATMDIHEILSVKNKPSNVNIVLETGGAKKWTNKSFGKYGNYNISSTKLQRHHVTSKGKLKLDEELTYSCMGYSSTLQSFLEFGLKKYPAKKTALILWNHGGGLQGVCFDEKKNDEGLDAKEVTTAVSKALTNTGHEGEKLEWIGYDACLMAVQDNAELNSKYFNYMVCSEETEAGYGWDYDTWIDDLYALKDTPTILQAICDGFIADNDVDEEGNDISQYNDQTLSYLDLRYAEEYKNAWENMAFHMSITRTNKSSFRSLVNSCKYYAGTSYSYYCLFDAKDFVQKLANNSTFNPGEAYTQPVLNALAKLVAHTNCGAAAGNSNGLCMYWPTTRNATSYNTYDSTSTNFSNWSSLVSSYGGSGW